MNLAVFQLGSSRTILSLKKVVYYAFIGGISLWREHLQCLAARLNKRFIYETMKWIHDLKVPFRARKGAEASNTRLRSPRP